MGKTSIDSRFNISGSIAWILMIELPGVVTLLYLMFALPSQNRILILPLANWLMADLFSILPLLAFATCLMLIIYFAFSNTDYPLHLQSHHWTSPQPFHVAHTSHHISLRHHVSAFQRHEYRQLARVLCDPLRPRTGKAVKSGSKSVWSYSFWASSAIYTMMTSSGRLLSRSAETGSRQHNEGDKLGDKSVAKVYMVPEMNDLLRLVLYSHYLSE